MRDQPGALDPGDFCRQALRALDASQGRSRRRKRDQTPDNIGMGIKRELLERAVEECPSPDAFEGWLVEQLIGHPASGGARAMAGEILAEYRLAASDTTFRAWLEAGAPSADAEGGELAPVEFVTKSGRGARSDEGEE